MARNERPRERNLAERLGVAGPLLLVALGLAIGLLPFVEVPEIPTIEDLFDRIEQAIGSGAATVDVSWDAKSGIPLSAFIDFDPLLADEEQGWNVESITLNP